MGGTDVTTFVTSFFLSFLIMKNHVFAKHRLQIERDVLVSVTTVTPQKTLTDFHRYASRNLLVAYGGDGVTMFFGSGCLKLFSALRNVGAWTSTAPAIKVLSNSTEVFFLTS